MNKDLLKYLSTAPVLGAIWIAITAAIIVEFNRLYPGRDYRFRGKALPWLRLCVSLLLGAP
jgi:photosystem I subunit 9